MCDQTWCQHIAVITSAVNRFLVHSTYLDTPYKTGFVVLYTFTCWLTANCTADSIDQLVRCVTPVCGTTKAFCLSILVHRPIVIQALR